MQVNTGEPAGHRTGHRPHLLGSRRLGGCHVAPHAVGPDSALRVLWENPFHPGRGPLDSSKAKRPSPPTPARPPHHRFQGHGYSSGMGGNPSFSNKLHCLLHLRKGVLSHFILTEILNSRYHESPLPPL